MLLSFLIAAGLLWPQTVSGGLEAVPERHVTAMTHSNGVWFIHRESPQDQEQVPVEFLLPKQRDGRRNVMEQFWFTPKFQRFDARVTSGTDENR
jgi:hypothetical protein